MKIAGLVTSCGESFTPQCIASLAPWVDFVIAVIDDRTPHEFDATLGVEAHRFTFRDDFAAIPNCGVDLLQGRCDILLQLDADELLYDGHNLRRVIENSGDAEVIGLPRRHWHDLERTRECQYDNWFPDIQWRLRRPHVRMEGRVHPGPAGSPRMIRTSIICLEHFNLAFRSDDDWKRVNSLYARIGSLS